MTKKNKKPNANINTKTFTPKTENQSEYVRSIVESDITICYGPAGSGKSMGAVGIASALLKEGKYNKICLFRSIVNCGNDLGALPGSIDEKVHPYFIPYIDYLEMFLGEATTKNYMTYRKIEFFPVEIVRGHTYNNSIMIVEEAQNLSPKQMKLIMTRMGMNSKMIIVGDDRQSDTKENALSFCIEAFSGEDFISVVELTEDDIQRNAKIRKILQIFRNSGF